MKLNRQHTDEQIMHKLSKGQLKYAAELFERYHVRLYNFYLYQGVPKESAEDLVQVVFERLIRYRKSFHPGMPFRSWLYQIARNAKSDLLKKRKLLISDFTEVDTLQLKDEGMQEHKEKQGQVNKLRKALEQLTEDNRELILLTRFQKMKYKEVADMLGISEGAVKVKVHRAIKQLRGHYFKIERL